MKLFIFAIIMSISVMISTQKSSFAADWVAIDERHFIDMSSIKKNKNEVSAFIKVLTTQEAGHRDKVKFKLRDDTAFSIDKQVYYCAEKRISAVAFILYDNEGQPLLSHNFPKPYPTNEIFPDTLGERVYNIVCPPK